MRGRLRIEGVLAACVAAASLALAAAWGSERGTEADLRTSSFVNERRGARALYLVLESVGVPVERMLEPPRADMPTDATLVVAAPSQGFSPGEARATLDWVAAGGRLVVADAPSTPQHIVDCAPLLAPAGLVTRLLREDARGISVLHEPWQDGVGAPDWPARIVVEEGPAGARDARAGEREDLVVSTEGPLVARVPFGAGEVVCVADERLFTNEHARRLDLAVLAVRVLAGDGTRRVVFDEFHHGFGAGDPALAARRLLAMLPGTWPGRAILVLLLAGIVHAAGASVRFGAPQDDAPPPRRALREHADALGRLLEGAAATKEALELLLAGVRRAAGPRTGIPAHLPPAEFRTRLARSAAAGAAELAETLAEAEAAAARPRVKDVEFARIAARVAAARRRFLDG